MNTPLSNLTLILLIFLCGCDTNMESASETRTVHNATAQTQTNQAEVTQTESVIPKIEPGFYRDGDDYERVSAVLAKSDASILLDYHSGIEWYDKSSKTRSVLVDINDAKPLLASIQNKRLVTVSTGKAAWDKYDEYIAEIAKFADELGFEMTIVTDSNGQGLVISRVIQH